MQGDVLGILPRAVLLCPAPPCPGATLETRATEYLGLSTGNTCPMGRKMVEYPRGDAGPCKENTGHS